jgi:hypothetical protein
MANVPIYEGGPVPAPEATPARLQAQDFGPGIGRGVQALGEGLGQASEVANHISGLHDEAVVKEQVNGVNQWTNDALYTGPNALLIKKGKDALDTAPMVQKSLPLIVQEHRAQLQNDRQRFLFDEAVNPQLLEAQKQVAVHAANETFTYAADESQARVLATSETAKLVYLDNPHLAEQHIATMQAEIANLGKLKGWGPDQIRAEQVKNTSATYHDIGLQIAGAGPQGWELSREFVKQHAGDMTDDDRRAVTDKADTEQRAFEAEQRRQEAELRRQETEAKRDARDRATSALGLLDNGAPMDPADYASAMADAQKAGDTALIKRLTDGQLKNTALFTHRSDTPVELQDNINSLSAKIAKAGTKADPADVVTLSALQQLHGNSTEQLRSNGLAWGAQHLGVTVPTLNPSDPNSIAQRVQIASAISHKTGINVSPLQPDEVQPLAQSWRMGDAAHKTNLVMTLARFGPLAPDAAQQVAPNDAGLLHLIGLASHSNHGVAISRVNQAIAGYEAMKTEGQIVGKLAKLPDFNTYVGNSLQFMPGARDGVFTVAKALLAEDAAQKGWADDTAADDKAWYRATNSALGAYNRGNVQYGGLAGFNGAQTVLPENMSLDDFEGRIARANDRQFLSAGNGVPVTGSGVQLNAGDLKKMHFIPVDDGVYRFEAGGSFVHTKDGHPFELDVRKLTNLDAELAAHGYVRR